MNEFTLGGWINFSFQLGGVKKRIRTHVQTQCAFFEKEKDRDAFFELSKERYPEINFTSQTYDGLFVVQVSQKL